MPFRFRLLPPLLAALALLSSGCTIWRVTNSDHSAVEQLLVSTSVDRAVGDMDFSSLRGRTVFVEVLDEKGDEPVSIYGNNDYYLSAIRARLGQAGARLVSEPAQAEIIAEVRCGSQGTDHSDILIGIPALPIPSPSSSGMLYVTPEVPFFKKSTQIAVIKLALFARVRDSGEFIGNIGPKYGNAYFTRWAFFFIPYETTDIPPPRGKGRPNDE